MESRTRLSKQTSDIISENVEEYLEALWISEEEGNPITKIDWVAKRLHIKPPSVVEMFKKLAKQGLVKYYPYRGVQLLEAGRTIAQRVIRNHRLIELLMKTLNIEIDENLVCGIEHHVNETFAKALYTFLGNPKKCPHGKDIPEQRISKELVS
jgi:DtxR family Mn-dependent transcriptional regulator